MKKISYSLFVCIIINLSCSADIIVFENLEQEENTNETNSNVLKNYKILSLGDSYTIGQSVCKTCRFPEQLKKGISEETENFNINLEIIAKTGWTTSNLLTAIKEVNPTRDQDLVTLLIGVNNQYQNKAFSVFETEFPELLNKAIRLAQGYKNKVIVISIPDYAFTPFGADSTTISKDIDSYNNFIESHCKNTNVTYAYITDITRNGLLQTNLVASDGLHPSKLAYSNFVERILPIALSKIQ